MHEKLPGINAFNPYFFVAGSGEKKNRVLDRGKFCGSYHKFKAHLLERVFNLGWMFGRQVGACPSVGC